MTNKPVNNRDVQGKFKRGMSGNPDGRPLGSKNHNGLTACLHAIEKIVTEEVNIKLLQKQVAKEWKTNPLKFYYKYCMPLLPKNMNIDLPGIVEAIAKINLKPLTKKKSNE